MISNITASSVCVFNSHLYHVGRSFHSPVYMLVCSNCVVLIFLWDRRKIPNNWWNMEWCAKNMIGTHPLSSLPVPCLSYRPSPPGLSRSESWEGVELGGRGGLKCTNWKLLTSGNMKINVSDIVKTPEFALMVKMFLHPESLWLLPMTQKTQVAL